MSRKQAVHKFCGECIGKSVVRVCPSTGCPLWLYRLYAAPAEAKILLNKEWFDERIDLSEEQMKKAIREALGE